MKKKEIVVKANSKKSKSLFLFVFIFLLWLFEIVKPVFLKSYSVLPEFASVKLIDSNLIQIIGSLIVLLSLVLWVTTLLHFKRSLRFGLDENNSGKLITTGVFAFTRNPFFLSLNLYFIGITLILSNLFFVSFAVLVIVSIHFFILKEEKFLKKVYGEKYLNYTKKVKRYL